MTMASKKPLKDDQLFRAFPRKHLLAAGVLGAAIASISLFSSEPVSANRRTIESLPITVEELASLKEAETGNPEASSPAEMSSLTWQEQEVRSGDSLSTIFQRASLNARVVHQVASSQGGKGLRNIYPGEILRFGLNQQGELQELRYIKSQLETHLFTRSEEGFTAQIELREPEVLPTYREGVIEDSLFLSGQKANLPASVIMELANIFGWDIDFVFDIRQGDSFALVYEEKFLDGERIGTGEILAASFTNRGKTFEAVRFVNSKGIASYYTPEGDSMRKAFLRAPLDVFRVSSGFNLSRKHPIHKMIKAHRGVDYAAPRGTPVYSAGDGKVIASGYSKANGNYVFIQHGQKYTTKYLHLTKKYVKRGQSVAQRKLIGTVGSTGYATGPHLHYEFLVNGVHRNPRTVQLPQAQPVSKQERQTFELATAPLMAQLNQYRQVQLASADIARAPSGN